MEDRIVMNYNVSVSVTEGNVIKSFTRANAKTVSNYDLTFNWKEREIWGSM